MDAKLKKKWVKALLSGKYRQGVYSLRNEGAYCCLGVLGVCAGLSDSILEENALLEYDAYVVGAPTSFIQRRLANCNDLGVPFDMIAGLIDEAL